MPPPPLPPDAPPPPPPVAPLEPVAPVAPAAPVAPTLSCCANGSLVWNRLKASSWPDCGVCRTPGSLTPSAETADAFGVALPPPSDGGTIGPVVVGVVVELDELVADEAFALDWWSSFSVRGTWNASTASRMTPPIPA
ncbi:MAG: hypothetical protein E6F97_00795 [Actinobacteria bacterium]|nr:MAG: hypothetical protein E6F97_00795 [Actinomycetota bacterium]